MSETLKLRERQAQELLELRRFVSTDRRRALEAGAAALRETDLALMSAFEHAAFEAGFRAGRVSVIGNVDAETLEEPDTEKEGAS